MTMKFKSIIPIIFLLISGLVKASETYQATTQLNIRSGVGTSYSVVGSIARGDKVLIDTIISGWGQVIVDGQAKGFAAMKYLTTDIKEYSSNSKTEREEKSPWKSVVTILVILVIGYYQFFGKKKSASSKGSTSKAKYSPPKKVIMERQSYYCENCGIKFSNPRDLLSNSCHQHPNGFGKGKHILYQGSEKSKYFCKFCGTSFSNLRDLCGNSCAKHPYGFGKGHHRPAL
jgi:hypothetical protein